MRPLTIGSRGSSLALWQARHVRQLLQADEPDLEVRIEVMKTSGDRISESALARFGTTKGLFVKEIEEALLDGCVDLAVHSLKDVPTELPEALCLGAILKREDARDALVSPHPGSGWDLPSGAVVGTSSLRRQIQLRSLRRDFSLVPLRGNVDSRLRKMREQGLDGLVLAAAGLHRLGLEKEVRHLFDPDEMMPAVGQGALAVEVRRDDERTRSRIQALDHEPSRACTQAERTFLQAMGGGCQVPMGAYAQLEGTRAVFRAFLGNSDGSRILRETLVGPPDGLIDLSREAAEGLLSRGGLAILRQFEGL